MITWPGGLPGDCWQVHDTYSRCDEQDDDLPNWNDGSPADAPWRAAAYERAATRPCTGYGYRTHKGFRPNHCWMPGKSNTGPQSSCISVHAVARSPGAHI